MRRLIALMGAFGVVVLAHLANRWYTEITHSSTFEIAGVSTAWLAGALPMLAAVAVGVLAFVVLAAPRANPVLGVALLAWGVVVTFGFPLALLTFLGSFPFVPFAGDFVEGLAIPTWAGAGILVVGLAEVIRARRGPRSDLAR